MRIAPVLRARVQVPFGRASPLRPQHSLPTRGVEEFFEIPDVKKSWNRPITVGRAWKPSELRLKSFQDLHSLWYILIKERNLLLTQTQQYKKEPATRRLRLAIKNRYKKVKASMARVKTIINERRIIANYLKAVAHVKQRVVKLKYFVQDPKQQRNLYHNIIRDISKTPKWRRYKSEIPIRKQHMRFRNFFNIRKFEKEAILKDLRDWRAQSQKKSILDKLGPQILEGKSDQTTSSQPAETKPILDPYLRAMEIVKIFEQKRYEERQARKAEKLNAPQSQAQ